MLPEESARQKEPARLRLEGHVPVLAAVVGASPPRH
jgi:hypothetical protein